MTPYCPWCGARVAEHGHDDNCLNPTSMTTDAELRALRWRTGRKVGRTIYAQLGAEPSDADILIGMMDTPLLAAAVAATHNYWLAVHGEH